MKKAASRGGLVERPDSATLFIRSALLSEVVSANTQTYHASRRFVVLRRIQRQDLCALTLRLMLQCGTSKKLFADAFNQPCGGASAVQRTTTRVKNYAVLASPRRSIRASPR